MSSFCQHFYKLLKLIRHYDSDLKGACFQVDVEDFEHFFPIFAAFLRGPTEREREK